MKKKPILLTLILSLVVLLLAACGQNLEPAEQTDSFIQNNLPDATVQNEGNAIIEELELDNGSIIRFIDESASFEGGGVGILEIISETAKPIMASVKEVSPTPLEVFKLLAPDREAPSALLTHHEQLAKSSETIPLEARELSMNNTLETLDGGVLYSICVNDSAFKSWYFDKLHGDNNFKYSGFGADLHGTKYGVTGVSNRRALSVCHHPNNNNQNVQTRVEVRFGANLWFLIGGTLHNLDDHRGMWYASEGFSAARYRVKATPNNLNAVYSIAGSWGKK